MSLYDKFDAWMRSSGGGMLLISIGGCFALSVGIFVIAMKLITLVETLIK